MAQASSNANTNVGMMGETFKYVGPVAGALGYSIEDTAVAIGLMANSGIKASQAGTSLRKIFLGLQGGVELTGKELGKYHLEIENADGSMRELDEVMGDLRQAFSLMTDAEKTANAENIAGKTGMAGLLAIVNAGEDDYNKLTEAIENSAGASERMAEIRLDNLVGDLTLLKSAAEGAGIEIYRGFSANLRGITKGATSWITSFTGELEANIPTIQRQIKVFGRNVQEGFEPVIDFGKWCLNHPGVIKGTLAGIVTTMGTFKAFQAAKNGIMLLKTLSGMMSAWPVAAFGLAAGAIVGIGTAIKEAEREAAKANLAEHFGDIALSVEELEEVARHIVGAGGSLFDQLDSFGEVSDKAAALRRSLQKELNEISKASWKLSLGIQFDDGDTQSYVGAVEKYISDAQEYINSSGYELKLAANIVLGSGEADTEGDAFYSKLDEIFKAIQLNLQENLDDIAENGLTLPKERIVNNYLKDISEITQMITDAQAKAKFDMVGMKYSGMSLMSGDTFLNFQDEIATQTSEAFSGIDESMQEYLSSLYARKDAFERGIVTKEQGGLDQEGFDEKYTEAKAQQYQRKAEAAMRGMQVMKDTIMQTYGSEVQPALEAVEKGIQESLDSLSASDAATPEAFQAEIDEVIRDVLSSNSLSESSKNALNMLVDGMKPTTDLIGELIEQYKSAGGDMSEAAISGLQEGLNDTTMLSALSGSKDDLHRILGEEIGGDETLSILLMAARKNGAILPEGIIEGIEEKRPEAVAEAEEMLDEIRRKFETGFDATVPIGINYKMTKSYLKTGNVDSGLGGHADGGIFDTPHIAWFAEEGPEAVVPLDGSRRSVELWQETGRLLGAYEENNFNKMNESLISSGSITENKSSSSIAPVFSPVINVEGGANVREQVMDGLREGYDQFVEYMEQYKLEQYRVSF